MINYSKVEELNENYPRFTKKVKYLQNLLLSFKSENDICVVNVKSIGIKKKVYVVRNDYFWIKDWTRHVKVLENKDSVEQIIALYEIIIHGQLGFKDYKIYSVKQLEDRIKQYSNEFNNV